MQVLSVKEFSVFVLKLKMDFENLIEIFNTREKSPAFIEIEYNLYLSNTMRN